MNWTRENAKARWGGLPYYSVGQYYRERFGQRVQVVPVNIASTCPNRLGLKGMQTCSFCDVWGSSAYPELQGQPLGEQLSKKLEALGKRYRSRRFLVYFQAYTSTFLAVRQLRAHFEEALTYDGVVGFILGTRPDCLSPAVLALWEEYRQRGLYVSVELGVQTFDEEQLIFLRRGHTGEDSLKAIGKIREETDVDLGVHLMFGNPGETQEQMAETARTLTALGVHHVKLHNLHVLKDTPLAQWYEAGEFAPIELDEYTQRVIAFLQHLSPEVVVQRLVALSSRWDELLAPKWTRLKMQSSQFILREMDRLGAYQGQLTALSDQSPPKIGSFSQVNP